MSSSVLAIVTTVHLLLLVVRRHRSQPVGGQTIILLPAAAFSVLVWVAVTPAWIVVGLAAHRASCSAPSALASRRPGRHRERRIAR